MKRWSKTLFARLLLLQMGVALLVMLLFGALAMRQQAQALARATAPTWAVALNSVVEGRLALPASPQVAITVPLLPGPPPADADALRLYPRFRLLLLELQRLGVPARDFRVSGRTGEAVTWLELELADGRRQWVGVRSEFEGLDVRERGTFGFLIGLLGIAAGGWWLSRRILRPVSDLRQAMQRFGREGRLSVPPPVAEGAPQELHELSEQFAALARQRAALDEERRTMLAAISHDLRSPLTRIRMAAELLPDEAALAQRRDAIVRNVQVADRLLGSFIDFARSEHEPFDQPVELVALLRRVAEAEPDLVAPAWPAGPLWLARSNAVALERALRNLVDNARRHGAAPLELRLETGGGRVRLGLRDHGPGIAPAQRETLMQPFQRGDESRLQPGTGLGLAIAARVAERCGGRLQLTDARPGLLALLDLPIGREATG